MDRNIVYSVLEIGGGWRKPTNEEIEQIEKIVEKVPDDLKTAISPEAIYKKIQNKIGNNKNYIEVCVEYTVTISPTWKDKVNNKEIEIDFSEMSKIYYDIETGIFPKVVRDDGKRENRYIEIDPNRYSETDQLKKLLEYWAEGKVEWKNGQQILLVNISEKLAKMRKTLKIVAIEVVATILNKEIGDAVCRFCIYISNGEIKEIKKGAGDKDAKIWEVGLFKKGTIEVIGCFSLEEAIEYLTPGQLNVELSCC